MTEKPANLCFDKIISIEDIGEQETYDFCVPGTHNFIANDIVVHNSGHIEEDADTVLMLFRDSYYTDTTDLTTKIKIAKQRQGDAGLIVRVLYDKKNQTYKDLRW